MEKIDYHALTYYNLLQGIKSKSFTYKYISKRKKGYVVPFDSNSSSLSTGELGENKLLPKKNPNAGERLVSWIGN